MGKSCGKILQEMEKGKSQFKKGSNWWKFSIWNRVMGGQPIRMQLGKILRENLAGNSCGKILWEMEEGKSRFKKGSDWWKFSIWNRVVGSQPMRIQLRKILWEILAGKSCWKILWEILAGKSCRKWRRGKVNLRKAVFGGNLTFEIG